MKKLRNNIPWLKLEPKLGSSSAASILKLNIPKNKKYY
jgi:hypothetical protein